VLAVCNRKWSGYDFYVFAIFEKNILPLHYNYKGKGYFILSLQSKVLWRGKSGQHRAAYCLTDRPNVFLFFNGNIVCDR